MQQESEARLVKAKADGEKLRLAAEEKGAELLAAAQRETNRVIGERNQDKKQTASIKKELKKLLSERQIFVEQDQTLRLECERLTLDLGRKTRSLQDALQVSLSTLSLYFNNPFTL